MKPARATVVVFVAVVAVVAVIVAVVGLGTEGGTAITVGSTKISRHDLNDQLRALTENERFVKAVGQQNVSIAPGTLNSLGTASIVTSIVDEQLVLRILDEKGERITGDDRASAVQLRSSSAFDHGFDQFPQWFRTQYMHRLAAFAAFDRVTNGSTGTRRILRHEAEKVGVTVDPAYGLYRPRQVQVVPFPTPATPSNSSQG